MIQELYEKHVFLYIMGGLCGLGVFIKCFLLVIYNKLIKSSENMTSTKKNWLKNMKLRFESSYQLKLSVNDVDTYVDKYVSKIKYGGLLLSTWENISGQTIGLCLLTGSFAGILGFVYECGQGPVLFTFFTGAWTAIIVNIVDNIVNISAHKQMLRFNLIDYFENNLKVRMEQEVFHADLRKKYQREYFEEDQVKEPTTVGAKERAINDAKAMEATKQLRDKRAKKQAKMQAKKNAKQTKNQPITNTANEIKESLDKLSETAVTASELDERDDSLDSVIVEQDVVVNMTRTERRRAKKDAKKQRAWNIKQAKKQAKEDKKTAKREKKQAILDKKEAKKQAAYQAKQDKKQEAIAAKNLKKQKRLEAEEEKERSEIEAIQAKKKEKEQAKEERERLERERKQKALENNKAYREKMRLMEEKEREAQKRKEEIEKKKAQDEAAEKEKLAEKEKVQAVVEKSKITITVPQDNSKTSTNLFDEDELVEDEVSLQGKETLELTAISKEEDQLIEEVLKDFLF